MNPIAMLTTTSAVATGLMAGLYVGWAVSVLPGLALLPAADYLNTFQKLNRAILNPPFKALFFAAATLPVVTALASVSSYGFYDSAELIVVALLAAFGHGAVTVFGNIPINEKLDKLELATANTDTLTTYRHLFERNWRTLHWCRTATTCVAFCLLLAGTWS